MTIFVRDKSQLFGLSVAIEPTTMKNEKISPSVQIAHSRAAFEVAQNYIRLLIADTNNSLPRLEANVYTFRHEIADRVARVARVVGVYRMSFRPALLINLARAEIKASLEASPALGQKLLDIRAAQQAAATAEIAAEHASYETLPLN